MTGSYAGKLILIKSSVNLDFVCIANLLLSILGFVPFRVGILFLPTSRLNPGTGDEALASDFLRLANQK